MSAEKGSVFSRRQDKRFVKNVVSIHHAPSDWVPMDLTTTECKLMEIRKYSAGYHDIDTKFRRPNFELVSTYTVQNPFLLGGYNLRKEQLKMRASSLKEKVFFYPVTFAQLDSTVRHGIGPGTSGFSCLQVGEAFENQAAAFYQDSETANNLFQRTMNPRILIMAKVLVGNCQLIPEIADAKTCLNNQTNSNGDRVDTFTNEEKTAFLKTMVTESYPEAIIVYRDKNGVKDTRSCRFSDVVKDGCIVSYRSGTRYNPDEAKFIKPAVENTDGKTSGSVKRKLSKGFVKKTKKSPSVGKSSENADPNSPLKGKDDMEMTERGLGSEIEKGKANKSSTVVATVHAE